MNSKFNLLIFILLVFSFPLLMGQNKVTKPKVTFIELGSVSCIPCKQMQPILKSIETRYGSQISVIFYDVWKSEQKHFAKDYKVNLIPTQVFLDENGKEFFRHEGFFPESEIDKVLSTKAINPKK